MSKTVLEEGKSYEIEHDDKGKVRLTIVTIKEKYITGNLLAAVKRGGGYINYRPGDRICLLTSMCGKTTEIKEDS